MNQENPLPALYPAGEPDENFHFLAYPVHTLLWMCDTDGLCDFVSPSWLVFTGREAGQELGAGWLDRVHPDDLQALRHQLDEALREQQPFRLLYRLQRADGIYRWFVSQGMQRTMASGKVSGFIGQCFDVTAYQAGESEMEHAVQRMIALLKQTRLIAVVLDTEGRVVFSNGHLCRLLGYEGAELINCRLFERYLSPCDHVLLAAFYPGGQKKAVFPPEFESELLTSQGEVRHVQWHALVVAEYSGHVNSTILIGDNITEARRTEDLLKLTASVFEASNQSMLITDADCNILKVNEAFTQMTGYAREEVLGKNPRIFQSSRQDRTFYEQMWKSIRDTGHWRGDIWDRDKAGAEYPKFLSISAIRDASGKIANYSGIFYKITERKAIEEHLEFLAHYDILTGLPNRALLLDRLKLAIERAKREGSRIGLLYLDLDHFKQVNDTWGHAAGDGLLKSAARRMTESVRAVDTVARLGGDEFVVLVPDVREIDGITQVAQKILEALMPPYDIYGKPALATPSIGIRVYPDDHDDGEMLLRYADNAMYVAKNGMHGSFRYFSGIEQKDDPHIR